MRFQLVLLGAALVACGRDEPKAPIEDLTPPPPPATADVAALDEFGPFEGRVNGVAFWVHPSVPFNSMAIVSTDKGLLALNIEDGKEVARVEGFKGGAVQVIYDGVYPIIDPDGFKSRGVVVARDDDAGKIRFFEVHNAARELTELGDGFAVGEIEAFCAGPQSDGSNRLVVFRGSKMLTYDLDIGADRVAAAPTALVDQQSRDQPAPARSCGINKRNGDLFVLYDTGETARFPEQSGRRIEAFAPTRLKNPIGLELALNSSDEPNCCGQVGVLDGDTAAISLYDLDDGAPLGVARIAASFDVEGVSAATAFGMGHGNFGGPFRNGVLALAVNDGAPVLRLAPLNGALEALAVPFGEAANPRTLTPNSIEGQCKDLAAESGAVAECAPYRDEAPFAGPAIPEFSPPAPKDADTSLNEDAPAVDE